MSSSSRKRIYTQEEWNAADPLDRLYIHMMEPDKWELSDREDQRLEKLEKAWKIMIKKASPRDRIKLVAKALDCSEAYAGLLIKDAGKLFVETLDLDHELELRLAYHRFSKLYDKALDGEDFDAAQRALDRAMAVREKLEARQPKQTRIYAGIVFTDDPKALRARNADAEELEFELLPNAEKNILESEAAGVSNGH